MPYDTVSIYPPLGSHLQGIIDDTMEDVADGFVEFIRNTAGQLTGYEYWPVDTGISRDSFHNVRFLDHWELWSTDYAKYANAYYDDVLSKLWEEYDPYG